MRIQNVSLALALLALSACGPAEDKPPEEEIISTVAAFPTLPLPPDGQMLGSEGTGEARQLLISTPVGADTIVAFYRDVLSRPPFTLVNDHTQNNKTSLYAEQKGPPLWVTVEALEAGGTLVRLTGAAAMEPTQPDTTPAAVSPSGSDS